jgi:hypothetical protein
MSVLGARLAAGAALLWMAPVAGSSPPGPLELDPSAADFGELLVGELREITITATNAGDGPVVIEGVRLDPGDEALSVIADGCLGAPLDVGESCPLTIRFLPTVDVLIATELLVTTDRGSAAIPVTGSAAPGSAAIPPTAIPTLDDLGPIDTEPAAVGSVPLATEPAADELEPPEQGDSPPPTSAPSAPDIESCERRVRRFGLSAAFVPEVTMTQGTTESVGLALAVRGTPLDEPPGAGTSPTTIVEFDSDGCVVTAQLVGNGFEIAPGGLVEQSFITRDHLEWSWQVTPLRPGNLELQAQVTPWLVSRDGARHAGAASTYYADIAVTAMPNPQKSLVSRVNDVVGSPVGGTVVGVLVAGLSGTGIVNAIKKRRRRAPTT